ncbi:MAG: LysR family transcriptional regulator [Nocardioides sp.]
MTPAQLRAFAAVARWGSVKQAAAELNLTESAVSMHVAQLRKELGDALFSRTSQGIAFTPGGLRLATRSVELLGLQDLTVREVGQAALGRRILQIGASACFAEWAADGLLDAFTSRAGSDLAVELSVVSPADFELLLTSRGIDVALGPSGQVAEGLQQRVVLAYDVQVYAAPGHPFAHTTVSPDQLRQALWYLGPSGIGSQGEAAPLAHALGIPEERQRIFHSDGAAIEETKYSEALTIALAHTVTTDVQARRLVRVPIAPELAVGPGAKGSWAVRVLTDDTMPARDEFVRFLATPRAIQAMLRGSGVALRRARSTTHVTLWN